MSRWPRSASARSVDIVSLARGKISQASAKVIGSFSSGWLITAPIGSVADRPNRAHGRVGRMIGRCCRGSALWRWPWDRHRAERRTKKQCRGRHASAAVPATNGKASAKPSFSPSEPTRQMAAVHRYVLTSCCFMVRVLLARGKDAEPSPHFAVVGLVGPGGIDGASTPEAIPGRGLI